MNDARSVSIPFFGVGLVLRTNLVVVVVVVVVVVGLVGLLVIAGDFVDVVNRNG